MRIVVHAPEAARYVIPNDEAHTLSKSVRRALSRMDGAREVWVATEEAIARCCAEGCEALIVADANLTESKIRRISELEPPPLLIVADDPASTALVLRRIPVPEIVASNEESIISGLQRLLDSALLHRVLQVVRVHPTISRITQRWMEITLTMDPPYRYVGSSATDASTTPSGICAAWRRDFSSSSPREWLSFVRLVRTVEYRRGRAKWSRVARRLGMSLRTLQRLGHHYGARSLADLDEQTDQILHDAEKYFSEILTSPDQEPSRRPVSRVSRRIPA